MRIEDLFQKVNENACYPQRATPGSVGFDIRSVSNLVIRRRERGAVATGIQVKQYPEGCYIRIAERSSLAKFDGITVAGGVIDTDYWGEIYVLLINNTDCDFEVNCGDKVAQLIFERFEIPKLESEDFVLNKRIKGFGSSGN